MGAATRIDIHGAKGGESSPKQPTEAADSLRSTNLAKILIAVGEGEFDGTPTARDIYLDNTPIADASGNINFPNVKWEWRPGSVDQSYIPGIPSVENETTVNVELRSDNAWVRSLTDTQLSAVRVRLAWPALQRQDDEGNLGGYRIEYVVEVATDGGAYQVILTDTVDGKTTTRYERSRRIDLPKATSGWQLRIRRLTPNQNTNKIADTMLVAGYTEVIDEKLTYPNTALLYVEFDAEQFTNIPAVTVDCNGRKWQVPSNYDPVARTYSGIWDGTFKQAWTNNPAWATFGICTEDRFGLGKRIKPWMVDKWELYRIAQYCDQMIDNGVGGLEPRFLCDFNLQGKTDAWSLLRDISAIYRGMTYWAQGQLIMQADMPRAQDFDYVFTRANVIDGKFQYGSASAKTRYTRALVSYDNPANNYDTDVIAYADTALQRRLGDKPTEISAIGCTRASEAQRRAKWVVLSNSLDRTVSFKTGMEGRIPLPGFIIPIADSLLAGREIGGRISSSTARVVTLDRDTQAKAGDRLIINLPSGKAEGRTVQSVRGRAVTVTADYSELPVAQLQWALDADDLAIPLYRVLKVRRTTEGDYEISALQYEPSKFAAIDSGARLEERPISVIPVTTVQPPASVTLTSHSAIDQGIAINTMTIEWPAVSGAVAYDVEWRKDNGNWVKVQRTGATSVDVTGIYAGAYLARVRAVSAFDISSIWRSSMLTNLTGKVGLPPAVTSITTESLLFGIGVHWTFPPGAEDTQRTELWYSPGTDVAAATKLSDLAYPQSDYVLQNLRAGAAFFFWARLVDRSGNVGPFYPAGVGVRGEASSDAGAILDQIAGQVGESALGKELAAEIELISGIGPGSVNERLDEAKSLLAEQVAAVDTELEGVKTELQGQINAIAELADSMPYKPDQTYVVGQGVLGADGVIYQAVKAVPVKIPPPNTTYWLNVGQAVVTANGLAARVQTVETKVTSVEGVNTAQAQQITGLRTDVDGKASASSVQSIGNRVSTAENSISSQGSAITGLNNSLTSTNTNVSTAQTAANNAAALAGSKGKVLVQTAVPAAADQLAQNLWIDITGGANTPKRWNGSVWAPVTDKVATDAASAAANALAVASTKADASTVQSLSNAVTQQGTDLTAQGNALTNIRTSIGNVGGQNMVYNPSFDKAGSTPGVADGWVFDWAGGSRLFGLVTSTLDASGLAQRIDMAGISTTVWNRLQSSVRADVTAGLSYIASMYVRATAGLMIKIQVNAINASGTGAGTWQTELAPATGDWQRLWVSVLPQAGTTKASVGMVVYGTASLTTGYMETDKAQLKVGTVLDGWIDNNGVVAAELAATASAVSSLSGAVTQHGDQITSQAASVVNLNASIRAANAAGDNVVPNATFDPAYNQMGFTVLPSTDAAVPAGCPLKYVARLAARDHYPSLAAVPFTAVKPGDVWRLSALAACRTGSATFNHYVQIGSDPATIERTGLGGGAVAPTGAWTRATWDYTVPAGVFFIRPFLQVEQSASSPTTVWFASDWHMENVTAAKAAQTVADATASALTTTQATVTQQGAALTSQSSRVTNLENNVNSTTTGLATKASTAVVESLAGTVTQMGSQLTSQASSVTSLTASIRAANAAGDNVVPNPTFDPAYNQMGYTVVATSGSAVPTGCPFKYAAFLTGRDHVPAVAAVPFVATKPGDVWRLSALVVCAVGTAAFNLYIQLGADPATSSGTGNGGGRITPVSAWTRTTWDYIVPDGVYFVRPFLQVDQAGSEGGTQWLATDWHMENITAAKAAQTKADATASAISATQATVTQQGNALTAQATQLSNLTASVGSANTAIQTETTARTNADTALGRRVDTVQSSVSSATALIQSESSTRANADAALGRRVDTVQSSLGDTNASVQQTSTALAGLNGQVNAQYSVKVMTTSSGMRVAAGFGLGLESEGGVTQSTFAVSADRFVVLNANLGSGATLSSPFAIENGQVFIADAYIKKATIQQGIVGQSLYSQTFTNYGAPVMNIDFNVGEVIVRHKTTDGAYMFIRQDGIFMVQNGVVVVELSMG